MYQQTKTYLLLLGVNVCLFIPAARGITNNADLIWYEKGSKEPHNYLARQPIPEGLIKSEKIVVNQKLPMLWEVKFAFFDNLETLVIDDCGVNEIKPNTFVDLKPLTTLSLSRNNIKEIKEGVFNSVEVKTLNLAHNKISIIASGAFDNMPVLNKVILDFNELKRWDSRWFFNCTNIEVVSATHNFLEELPENAFGNLRLEGDKGLYAYFSYNKIERIDPEAFQDSGNFKDLFLDWNELRQIDGHTFGKLSFVEHLNLNGDSLKCLPEEFMNNILNRTNLLSVKSNPLECDCLKRLQDRVDDTEIKISFSKDQIENCE